MYDQNGMPYCAAWFYTSGSQRCLGKFYSQPSSSSFQVERMRCACLILRRRKNIPYPLVKKNNRQVPAIHNIILHFVFYVFINKTGNCLLRLPCFYTRTCPPMLYWYPVIYKYLAASNRGSRFDGNYRARNKLSTLKTFLRAFL